MYKIIISLLFVGATTNAAAVERLVDGNRATENVPELPASLVERAAQYANIRSASFRSWHPSGEKLLVSTRLGNTAQLYLVSQPLGLRSQLTYYDEPVAGGEFSPAGQAEEILFQRDVGGNENYIAFTLNLKDGTTRRLTPDDSQARTVLWSSNGTQFAYQSNRDDRTRFDVWIADADQPENARMLVKGTGFYWYPVEWSPDDSKLVVLQAVSGGVDARPFIVDVKTGDMTRIGPTDVTANYGAPVFTADGKSLYIDTDLSSEFSQLSRYDIDSGKFTTLTEDIPWNVSAIEASGDRKTIAFTTNEDGISRLYFLDTADDSIKRIADIPEGVIRGIEFAPDDNRLAFSLGRSNAPTDTYVYDPKNELLTRWTRSEVGGLDESAFVSAELIRYPTFDQINGKPRQIPAFVYRPAQGKGPFPVIVQIHGGPAGQTRPSFYSNAQYWANELGLIVVRPNVRGSSGYGKNYLKLDDGLLREESVKDIGALLDWIGTQPDMDADRIALFGGSYGGYMVLASMTHYDDRIRAGIDYFGVSNFATFLKNTSDYRRDHRRQEYGDERIPEIGEFLNRTAPTNNVHKISKPLLVLQGSNDPRVTASESEQIVQKVRQNEVEVWYVLYDDEGHGFRKLPNRIHSSSTVSMFLQEHLLD